MEIQVFPPSRYFPTSPARPICSHHHWTGSRSARASGVWLVLLPWLAEVTGVHSLGNDRPCLNGRDVFLSFL